MQLSEANAVPDEQPLEAAPDVRIIDCSRRVRCAFDAYNDSVVELAQAMDSPWPFDRAVGDRHEMTKNGLLVATEAMIDYQVDTLGDLALKQECLNACRFSYMNDPWLLEEIINCNSRDIARIAMIHQNIVAALQHFSSLIEIPVLV